jgi:hypothetical protein
MYAVQPRFSSETCEKFTYRRSNNQLFGITAKTMANMGDSIEVDPEMVHILA